MTGHIFIYGEIGNQVTAKSVQDQIDKNATEYEVHISSVGGDVYEGYAIYGILQSLQKPTTVRIEGLCASIATLIAQAGDKVIMTDPAEFMIHNPNVTLSGEATDLVDAAEQLERIKKTIISVYRKKTGLSDEELSAMMDMETWMTADEAKQRGFVDEVQEKLKAVAYIDTNKIKMKSIESILKDGLAELKNMIAGEPKNVATVTLADGRVLTVNTESGMPTPEEMVGASVALEDGSPLEDGTFPTAEGVEITVAGGVITQAIVIPVEEEEAKMDPKDAEIAELKKKLSEMEASMAAKETAVAEATQKVEAQNKTIKSFTAKVNELENKIGSLKAVTVGEKNPPVDAPNKGEERPYDPMNEWYDAFKSSRK